MFQLTWYLDAVSPNWCAIIDGDYNGVFPLTEIRKKGQDLFVQAPFSREYEFAGGKIGVDFWDLICSKYKYINFRTKEILNDKDYSTRTYQFIDLESELSFSKNAKRLIKKSKQLYTFKKIDNVDLLISLVKEILSIKIKELTQENIVKLKQLMENAVKNNSGTAIGVFSGDKFVGGGFFFYVNDRVTYLKGVSMGEDQKNGAMYGMFDYAINLFESDYKIFDFGGSDIKNVAQFYKKFGAINHTYYSYEINQLPFWYKMGQKLFKK